jgi:hypothetical protein
MSPPSPRLTGLPHSAVPYFFIDQLYDSTQATELLSSFGVSCPGFASYAHNVVAYAAKHPG